eukprot:4054385-Pyramimonas_sp.AAC.1
MASQSLAWAWVQLAGSRGSAWRGAAALLAATRRGAAYLRVLAEAATSRAKGDTAAITTVAHIR